VANASTTNEINHIKSIMSIPPTLETTLHKPLRTHVTLYLPPNTSTPPTTPNTSENNAILTCYKEHRMATRFAVKHGNTIRYNKHGSALLQMFVRNPRDALKSILKTASNEKKTPTALYYNKPLLHPRPYHKANHQ